MKILHIVPGLNEGGNGISVAAKLVANWQCQEGHEVELIDAQSFLLLSPSPQFSEIWVHSNWRPITLLACLKVLFLQIVKKKTSTAHLRSSPSPLLVRMPHANLDPLRYHSKGWKKRFVRPFELWLYRQTAKVVVTCEAEKRWCQDWGVKCPIEVLDLKRFFDLKGAVKMTGLGGRGQRCVHALFLGRANDPLKGVTYLKRAVEELDEKRENGGQIELKIVSSHFGAELEKDWEWCDVLVLPTLSENFGLVVAEALERGKFVITTDGAPAWGDLKPCQGIYIKGFRNGAENERIALLKNAIARGLACSVRSANRPEMPTGDC